jgi:hypothetical protein
MRPQAQRPPAEILTRLHVTSLATENGLARRAAAPALVWGTVDVNCFDPSPERAEAVRVHMQSRLADSLRYILDECEGHVPFSRGDITSFLGRLESGPVSPMVFGAYCDLVLALDADALDEAQGLLAELARSPNVAAGPAIVDLAEAREDVAACRYQRFADSDIDLPFRLWPPKQAETARVRALIGDAFALLDAGNPALASEIRVLLREIVLAAGEFEGISCYMLWGGVILNDSAYKTVLEMVQVLAHESGHNLLFGLCADGPLHENDDTARFSSPLRVDPRPMDGIVHATYVSARMHQAVQRLANAGVLDDVQMQEASAANAANAKRFAHGMETVGRRARLTQLGHLVMDGAQRHMSAYL